jgi:hypothetical protein
MTEEMRVPSAVAQALQTDHVDEAGGLEASRAYLANTDSESMYFAKSRGRWLK